MKQFTHLYLDDKGLKAIVAPDRYDYLDKFYQPHEEDYNEALQQAIKEGVYFDLDAGMENTWPLVYKKHELYPIPDGYEVKVEDGEWSVKLPTGSFIQYDEYAILVPKENVTPCPKCRTIDFIQTCHDMRCPLRGEEPQLKQQSTIEEAANSYLDRRFSLSYEVTTFQRLHKETFIAGAKSDAAREYWYEQFKQQKS